MSESKTQKIAPPQKPKEPAEKKKKRITRGGTVGWTPKPIKGQYYNLVDSLDGLICPPVPQLRYTDEPSRAPKEPPCCPMSTCCYPPPYCPRQPCRRCI